MSRIRNLLALAAAAALVVTGCSASPGGSSPEGEGSGSASVKIGVVPVVNFMPIYIATDDGIFEKHGLTAEIQTVQNFAAAVPSLLNGQLDYAAAAIPPVISGADENVPLLVVSELSSVVEDQAEDSNQVMIAAGESITRPADLAGKVVATNQIGSGPQVAAQAAYLKDGGDPDALKWVTMPFNEMIEAVKSHKVDAAAIVEPFITKALDQGLEQVFSPYLAPGNEVLEPGGATTVLVASTPYLAEKADVAERVQKAIAEAMKVASEDRSRVEKALVEHAGMSAEEAATTRIPSFTGTLDASDLQTFIDPMLDQGLIKNSLDGADLIWKK